MPIVDKDSEDSDHEEETTQTAEHIVLDSLASGALSEVCEVIRELDDKENDLVKEFIRWGCSAICDFGPKKTPCSMLFPVKHYQSLTATAPLLR